MLSRTGARQWWQRLTEISIVPAAAVSSSVLPRICKAWSGAWRPSQLRLPRIGYSVINRRCNHKCNRNHGRAARRLTLGSLINDYERDW